MPFHHKKSGKHTNFAAALEKQEYIICITKYLENYESTTRSSSTHLIFLYVVFSFIFYFFCLN